MRIRTEHITERFGARCDSSDEESMNGEGGEGECREGVACDVDVCEEAE